MCAVSLELVGFWSNLVSLLPLQSSVGMFFSMYLYINQNLLTDWMYLLSGYMCFPIVL